MSDKARSILIWAPVALALVIAGFLLFGGRGTPDSAAMDTAAPTAPAPIPTLAQDAARTPIPLEHAEPIPVRVYASPTCGCCSDWVAHMEENGFEVEVELREDMGEVKRSFGIPARLSSCHTGVVNGYLVEGHVPAADVRRFLAEAPDARGLAVPGMPIGSPGMEMGEHVDRYDVLVFGEDGTTEVFASHGG